MRYVVPLGRLLFAAIFLMSFAGHFSNGTIAYAASHGLPFARFLVPASGVVALLGAVSILLGFKAKLGAWLIVLFLVPVTVTMHNFWAVSDPAAAAIQRIMFMKNLAILGAALMITNLGAGPVSLDARTEARKLD